MMAAQFLTVDLGTSSLRTTLWNHNGKVIGQAVCEYPTRRPKPDRAEQSPDDWWQAFRKTVFNATRGNPSRVCAISIASQREGMVPIDATGKVLSDCIIWMDNRTRPQLEQIRNTFSDSEIVRITGLQPAIYYSACKLLWIMQHQPAVHQHAAWYLQPGEYLMMRLTGRALGELSMASRTMLLDIRKRCWSEKLLDDLHIPRRILPPLVEPGSIIAVNAAVAARLGISRDAVIVVGGGDQQCGALGCGAIDKTTASVSLGTSTTISLTVNRPFPVFRSGIPCCISAVSGKWEMEPSIWSSGSILSWLNERLQGNRKKLHKLLVEAEQIPPGSEGLAMLPYFMGAGSPDWDPLARGAWVGLTLGHTDGHLVRSVLEANAFDIRRNIEALNNLGLNPRRLVVNGRGSQSRLWCQIIADVTGRPVCVPTIKQAVSLGLFIMIHVALGYSRSVEQAISRFVTIARTYRPRRTYSAGYETQYNKFKILAATLKEYFNQTRESIH